MYPAQPVNSTCVIYNRLTYDGCDGDDPIRTSDLLNVIGSPCAVLR